MSPSIEDTEIMKIKIKRLIETAVEFYDALLDYQLGVAEPMYKDPELKKILEESQKAHAND